MKLASTLGNKQSFSILACIFALMSSTELDSFSVLGVLSYFFKEFLTFDLGVEVFEVFSILVCFLCIFGWSILYGFIYWSFFFPFSFPITKINIVVIFSSSKFYFFLLTWYHFWGKESVPDILKSVTSSSSSSFESVSAFIAAKCVH